MMSDEHYEIDIDDEPTDIDGPSSFDEYEDERRAKVGTSECDNTCDPQCDAQRAVFGCYNGRPRICKGCTIPPREGMFEVLPDNVAERPTDNV
jgi:hypothetical protein